MSTVVFGMNAKLYYWSAGIAGRTATTPVAGVELTNVKDLTLSCDSAESDVTTRANNGFKATLPTLKNAEISFDMVWNTGDTGFTALQSAWMNNTAIGIACMDGPIATTGSQGLCADFAISKFERDEKLAEAVTVKITIKITYSSTAPIWLTVSGS